MALGCGLSQINQGDKSKQYVVLDWGGGTNTSDAGCAYALFPVDGEMVKTTGILSLPKDLHRVVVENGVFKLGIGGREVQLYDLSGRRVQPGRLPQKGVFVIGTPHGGKVMFRYLGRGAYFQKRMVCCTSILKVQNFDDYTDKKIAMMQQKINNSPNRNLILKKPKMSPSKDYCNFALAG